MGAPNQEVIDAVEDKVGSHVDAVYFSLPYSSAPRSHRPRWECIPF
jgi:hypothetical protein